MTLEVSLPDWAEPTPSLLATIQTAANDYRARNKLPSEQSIIMPWRYGAMVPRDPAKWRYVYGWHAIEVFDFRWFMANVDRKRPARLSRMVHLTRRRHLARR